MLKEYQITNFKAFATPATIPIKPITLIFGPNSSGKSAILQSLLMLTQTLKDNKGYNIPLLPKGSIVDLGTFQQFIHNHDITESFSFKMTFSAPKDIWEGSDIYVDDTDKISFKDKNNLFILANSIQKFKTIGLEITFSLEKNSLNIMIPQISLYIGDNNNPVISYEPDSSRKLINAYFYKENFDHKYWYTYWQSFDETHKKNIILLTKFRDGLINISRKETNNELKRREIKGDISEGTESFKGFDDAIKAYSNMYKGDSLSLVCFIPALMDYFSLIRTIGFNFDNDEEKSRDVSLFTLTMGNLIKQFLEKIVYIGPLRETPRRHYIYRGIPFEEVGSGGEMVPDVLFNNPDLIEKINKEFSRFGINYNFKLSPFWNDQTNICEVFSIDLIEKFTGNSASIRDVGFGISQVLPIIMQSLLSVKGNILIEQPELHLHPALQAELGDLFIDSALGEQKNTFIIETHSEHLILRILRRIRETSEGELPDGIQKIFPNDVAIIYAQPTREGSRIVHVPITEDGEFEIPWPEGFFTERAKELF